MSSQKLDYNKLHCSLCHDEIPSGAFFQFVQCEKCGDTIHDACHRWISPKIVEELEEGTQLWRPFCQFCGLNKYKVITPELWKTPSGQNVETGMMWKYL